MNSALLIKVYTIYSTLTYAEGEYAHMLSYEWENVTKHWSEMPVCLKFWLGKLIIFVLSFM